MDRGRCTNSTSVLGAVLLGLVGACAPYEMTDATGTNGKPTPPTDESDAAPPPDAGAAVDAAQPAPLEPLYSASWRGLDKLPEGWEEHTNPNCLGADGQATAEGYCVIGPEGPCSSQIMWRKLVESERLVVRVDYDYQGEFEETEPVSAFGAGARLPSEQTPFWYGFTIAKLEPEIGLETAMVVSQLGGRSSTSTALTLGDLQENLRLEVELDSMKMVSRLWFGASGLVTASLPIWGGGGFYPGFSYSRFRGGSQRACIKHVEVWGLSASDELPPPTNR